MYDLLDAAQILHAKKTDAETKNTGRFPNLDAKGATVKHPRIIPRLVMEISHVSWNSVR